MLISIEDRSWLNMAEGEEVIWSCHPTVLMYLPNILLGSIAAVIGMMVYFSGYWQGLNIGGAAYTPLVLTLAGTLYILYQLLLRQSIYYVATTKKVVRKDGIVRRYRNPVNYTRISNMKARESVLERIVSFIVPKQEIGDILIHTSDDNLGDLKFEKVGSVQTGLQTIQEQLNSSQHYRSASEQRQS